MRDMNHTFVEEASAAGHSFEWLEAHADYLFNLAVGQVRDKTAAEDLVQETFLAALKARDSFRGQSSDQTWLVGILRSEKSFARTDQEVWDESPCFGPMKWRLNASNRAGGWNWRSSAGHWRRLWASCRR